MSASYTPGPYVAHGREDGRGLSWTVGRPETGSHFTLARVFRPAGDGPGVARANATLFAAAPDLVEACQELIAVIDSVDGEAEYTKEEWATLGSAKLHAEGRIRTALSKALGEGEGK